MDVGEMIQLLDEREEACRAECDRLQAEAERIGGLLAVCRQELERLVTARGVVCVLAVAHPAAFSVPVSSASLVAARGDVEVFTERVLAVLAESGRTVRCGEVVTALGEDASVAPACGTGAAPAQAKMLARAAGQKVPSTAGGPLGGEW